MVVFLSVVESEEREGFFEAVVVHPFGFVCFVFFDDGDMFVGCGEDVGFDLFPHFVDSILWRGGGPFGKGWEVVEEGGGFVDVEVPFCSAGVVFARGVVWRVLLLWIGGEGGRYDKVV